MGDTSGATKAQRVNVARLRRRVVAVVLVLARVGMSRSASTTICLRASTRVNARPQGLTSAITCEIDRTRARRVSRVMNSAVTRTSARARASFVGPVLGLGL